MVMTTTDPSQKFPNSDNNVCIPSWTTTSNHVQDIVTENIPILEVSYVFSLEP